MDDHVAHEPVGLERPPDPNEINAILADVDRMVLQGLRRFWSRRWGTPPRLRSVEMLKLLIAWRLQTEAWGGLDAQTKTRLRRKRMPPTVLPHIGTKLVREYLGVAYTVELVRGGVIFDGVTYGSLTEVAEKITGTHWSGPYFFGLRR